MPDTEQVDRHNLKLAGLLFSRLQAFGFTTQSGCGMPQPLTSDLCCYLNSLTPPFFSLRITLLRQLFFFNYDEGIDWFGLNTFKSRHWRR